MCIRIENKYDKKEKFRYKDMLKGQIISTAGKLKSAEKCLIRPKIPKAKRSFSEN